jgi:hypothetical protein
MRHMLRRALQRCLTEPGWCDYQNRADTSDLQADQLR